MEPTKQRTERCVYCGRYYKPNPRVWKIQKSCSDQECRAKRKRESHQKWLEANPDCFKGRYVEIKSGARKIPITSVSGEKSGVRYKTRYPRRASKDNGFSDTGENPQKRDTRRDKGW